MRLLCWAATSSSKVNLCPSEVKRKITKNKEKSIKKNLKLFDFFICKVIKGVN